MESFHIENLVFLKKFCCKAIININRRKFLCEIEIDHRPPNRRRKYSAMIFIASSVWFTTVSREQHLNHYSWGTHVLLVARWLSRWFQLVSRTVWLCENSIDPRTYSARISSSPPHARADTIFLSHESRGNSLTNFREIFVWWPCSSRCDVTRSFVLRWTITECNFVENVL